MKEVIRIKHFLVLVLVGAIYFLGFVGQVKGQTGEIGPLLAKDLLISTGETAGEAATVAFDGSRYLAVWSQRTDNSFYYLDIYGQFVDTSGALSGTPFLIASQRNNQRYPAVAFSGTHYLVVWYDNLGTASRDTINGRVVATDGQLLGTELVLSSSSGVTNLRPDVASDGTGFLAVWEMGHHIYGQRIAVDGAGNAVLDGVNFLVSPGVQRQLLPSVVFGQTNYLVTWANEVYVNTGQYDVFGALVSPSGTVSAPIAICTAPGPQNAWGSWVAFDGTNFLVVYASGNNVFGTRVSESGILLDGPPDTGGIQITSSGNNNISVAFGKSEWLVVFGSSVRTCGVRVGSDGVVLDPYPIDLFVTHSFQWFQELAFDGTNFLVTWWNSSSSPWTKYAQLVGPISNTPPIADAGPDQSVHVGDLVTLDGSGSTDPDGNVPLTYEWRFISMPDGSTALLSNPTTVNPTFIPDIPGDYVIQLIVTDSLGATSAPDTVTINATIVNRPPVLDLIGNKTVNEGELLQFTVNATDPDGDSLTYSATNLPTGATFVGQTFSWTPTYEQAGTYPNVHFEVSDGTLTDSEDITITVNDVNQPPVLDPIGDKTVDESQLLQFAITATDLDGDPLTYSATNLPTGATFVGQTFSWTPTYEQAGVYPDVHFEVSDGTLTDSEDIAITVNDVNQPPVANANGPYLMDEGFAITFDASGSSDTDGDPLQYRWDFDNDGTWDIEWSDSPTASNTWIDDWTGAAKLEVSDGELTDTDTADVTVNNVSPTVETGLDQEVLVGDTVSFGGSFTDPSLSDTHAIGWNFGDGDNATGTLTPTHIYYHKGIYTVVLTVTDDDDGVGTDSLSVTVNPIPATIPATVDIDPDTLNLESKGKWITCYIELSQGYDITLIDGSTVLLNGIIPVYLGKEGWAKAEANESNIMDHDDGILERMVKFDRSEVADILEPGDEVEITVTGEVAGVDFEGTDIIRVIGLGKGKKSESAPESPAKTGVLQNYPNPFNPETWIPFSLSEKAHVVIKIYNITGQLIRTLDLGEKEPGEYVSKEKAAYWDGRNNSGEEVASGIYFYQLQIGSKVFTKKMVVLK